MPGYPERFVKLLYCIIMAQFIVIATLLAGFSNEYLSNIYFRIWVDGNFPQLGLLLTGQVDALLIGMALGGTILLIQRVKNEASIAERTTATLGRPSPWRRVLTYFPTTLHERQSWRWRVRRLTRFLGSWINMISRTYVITVAAV